MYLYSRKLTWKPKKGPRKTTVLLKGYYMGFMLVWGSVYRCVHLGVNGARYGEAGLFICILDLESL